MKLLFDLTPLHRSSSVPVHGAARAAYALLAEALEARSGGENIAGMVWRGAEVGPEAEALLAAHGARMHAVGSGGEFQNLLAELRPDVFYSSEGQRYAAADFGMTKFVCTVHGLRSFEVFSDRAELAHAGSLAERLAYCAKNSMRSRRLEASRRAYEALFARVHTLVVSSEHTKYFMLAQFPSLAARAEDIRVVYPPRTMASRFAKSGVSAAEILEAYGVAPKEYVLMVSAGRWAKNALRGAEALDRAYAVFPAVRKKALLVGAGDPDVFLRRLKHPERFVVRGYAADGELEVLYKNAFLLLYPTLSEGFGYPPLEAMRHGTPVACSAASSVPEVCGAGAAYFNPYSVGEIEACVLRLLLDAAAYAALERAGKERYDDISRRQDEDMKKMCSIILQRES